MNRVGFMGQLESLLSDIPPAEKEEALQYYNDYFDDAGEMSEEDVIRSLGSPAKVAETIKSELRGERISAQVKPGDHAVIRYGSQEETQGAESAKGPGADVSGMPVWCVVLIVIGLCALIPAVVGLLTGLIGVAAGLLACWFCLIAASAALCVGMFGASAVLVVVAALCFSASPITFMTLLGLAMFCAGAGILALMLSVLMAGKATPAIFCGLKKTVAWICGGIRKMAPRRR